MTLISYNNRCKRNLLALLFAISVIIVCGDEDFEQYDALGRNVPGQRPQEESAAVLLMQQNNIRELQLSKSAKSKSSKSKSSKWGKSKYSKSKSGKKMPKSKSAKSKIGKSSTDGTKQSKHFNSKSEKSGKSKSTKSLDSVINTEDSVDIKIISSSNVGKKGIVLPSSDDGDEPSKAITSEETTLATERTSAAVHNSIDVEQDSESQRISSSVSSEEEIEKSDIAVAEVVTGEETANLENELAETRIEEEEVNHEEELITTIEIIEKEEKNEAAEGLEEEEIDPSRESVE